MKKDLDQDVTTIALFACGTSPTSFNHSMVIWMETYLNDPSSDQVEKVSLQSAFDYIVEDAIRLMVRSKLEINDPHIIDYTKYYLSVSKVKGNKCWFHDYEIDPRKLLRKKGFNFEVVYPDKQDKDSDAGTD